LRSTYPHRLCRICGPRAPGRHAHQLGASKRKPGSEHDLLALRRSELVEIDYETRGEGLAVLHMTDDALDLQLLRSKGSQEKPVVVVVDRHHNPHAFAAIERWIAHAGIQPGTALFRRIHPRGGIGERITADGVGRAVKAALVRCYVMSGVDKEKARQLAERYSGHSGRVGFVVVASTTRHRSLQMIKRYGETADQRLRAPHRLPGVGL